MSKGRLAIVGIGEEILRTGGSLHPTIPIPVLGHWKDFTARWNEKPDKGRETAWT